MFLQLTLLIFKCVGDRVDTDRNVKKIKTTASKFKNISMVTLGIILGGVAVYSLDYSNETIEADMKLDGD